MPKESTVLGSRLTLVSKALEILRLGWSDRRQPCATTSQQTAPTGQIPGNDGPCTPGLQSISGHAVNETTQPSQQRPGLARALGITKQRLAEHLSVTTRWIELQQQRGLPHIHTPGMNRYRISEVEDWLREQYGGPQDP
jgi:hypothetical protein